MIHSKEAPKGGAGPKETRREKERVKEKAKAVRPLKSGGMKATGANGQVTRTPRTRRQKGGQISQAGSHPHPLMKNMPQRVKKKSGFQMRSPKKKKKKKTRILDLDQGELHQSLSGNRHELLGKNGSKEKTVEGGSTARESRNRKMRMQPIGRSTLLGEARVENPEVRLRPRTLQTPALREQHGQEGTDRR